MRRLDSSSSAPGDDGTLLSPLSMPVTKTASGSEPTAPDEVAGEAARRIVLLPLVVRSVGVGSSHDSVVLPTGGRVVDPGHPGTAAGVEAAGVCGVRARVTDGIGTVEKIAQFGIRQLFVARAIRAGDKRVQENRNIQHQVRSLNLRSGTRNLSLITLLICIYNGYRPYQSEPIRRFENDNKTSASTPKADIQLILI